jgi:metallophosphoesterase (TIGR00282 family)
LFLGDIVGRPGRRAVSEFLPGLVDAHQPLFVIANAENAAGGVGLTPAIAAELHGQGVHGITLGNHAFGKREIYDYLVRDARIARPANMPASTPGSGMVLIERDGVRLALMNVCGRVFMDGYDDPFACVDRLVDSCDTPHVVLDFHAEATSEKVAMGYHAEGRVSAVLGTHTHVATADERILPGGTAYITDVGMCGPVGSVIGMDREIILHRFRTSLPARFEVAEAPGVISAVVIDVERSSGRATAIERVAAGP